MTLCPSRHLGSRLTVPARQSWPGDELGRRCYVPECNRLGEPGGHHVIRRSSTGGAKRWVSIDGVVVLNLVRLCREHHRWVTGDIGGHRAIILWKDDATDDGGGWVWCEPGPRGWREVGPLFDRSRMEDYG